MERPYSLIELDEVDSTNNYLRRLDAPDSPRPLLVTAEYQTAGRGADTNSWESARGENLLFSLRVQPQALPARHMFAISETAALALVTALKGFLEGQGARGKEQEITSCPNNSPAPRPLPLAPCPLPLAPNQSFTIKWPNDIYYADSKVAGILIENDLQGAFVRHSTIGIGLNINQRRFLSDAPNPRSLADIVGHDLERRTVLERFMESFLHLLGQITDGNPDALSALHQRYKSRLFRFGQEHSYSDQGGTFRATLVDVEPSGHLVLRDTEGRLRRYAFKEVRFLINPL